jgi:hypothetical protein
MPTGSSVASAAFVNAGVADESAATSVDGISAHAAQKSGSGVFSAISSEPGYLQAASQSGGFGCLNYRHANEVAVNKSAIRPSVLHDWPMVSVPPLDCIVGHGEAYGAEADHAAPPTGAHLPARMSSSMQKIRGR